MHVNSNSGPRLMAIFALMLADSVVAQVPTPVFRDVSVAAMVSTSGGSYTYTYSLTNPRTNTLLVKVVDLDLKSDGRMALATPFPGRTGFQGLDGNNGFVYWGPGDANRTPPGMAFEGFGLTSPAPPTVRKIIVEPYILDYIRAIREDREAHGQEWDPAEQNAIELPFILELKTLGPLAVTVGSFEHWDTYIADVAQAGQLGWISDPTLLAGIQGNLTAARQAAVAQDSNTVQVRLQAVIDAIQASTPAQRTSEGYALVLFNAQALQPTIAKPHEVKLTVTPPSASYRLGETAMVTASLVDVVLGRPIQGTRLNIRVAAGPNEGEVSAEGPTDDQGRFALAYTGRLLGDDDIVACFPGGEEVPPQCLHAGVKWQGGADLAITLWSPPLLKTAPGNEFVVHEETSNIGDFPAPPSVTFYFMWNGQTGALIGQRDVPGLAPGAASRVDDLRFTVPADLPAGLYTLAACADGEDTVAETNEANNCSDSNLLNQIAIIPATPNRPPDCSKAAATPNLLWPPNHKLVPITITGVTDPDGDPVTITITGITQDEPTNGLGDGDTAPDGFGVGTSQAQVRAERSGTGNGRVYAISFRAEDGKGGSCTGVVKVGVPHDKKDTPIDDGQKYDSTK